LKRQRFACSVGGRSFDRPSFGAGR
jgi:hypothetical protein